MGIVRFCLDRDVLGTKDHLVVDDNGFWWTKQIPSETWHLNGRIKIDSDWCLDSVLKLGHCTPRLEPPEAFLKEMSILSGSLENIPIPWGRVMVSKAHQTFVKRLVKEVVEAMSVAPLDYYRMVWVPGNAVLKSLQPCSVDMSRWNDLIKVGEGNVSAIRSFKAGTNGLADPIVYDRFKTLTGRLTVHSGPLILTLKREHRNLLKSWHGKDGAIYAFDFAALEARILLYEYGRKCDDIDLYNVIAKELGYDRKAVKGAVIAKLYGMNDWALAKHLGIEGKEFYTFLDKFNAHFNTHDLLARVKAQFVATGKVINRYGRPVVVDEPQDNIFVSYYGQSTGVDVTMLGFKQVIDTLARKAPRIRPIFLLHDAIILDLLKEDLQHVQTIKWVRVKGYVQKFPLKLEKIS